MTTSTTTTAQVMTLEQYILSRQWDGYIGDELYKEGIFTPFEDDNDNSQLWAREFIEDYERGELSERLVFLFKEYMIKGYEEYLSLEEQVGF